MMCRLVHMRVPPSGFDYMDSFRISISALRILLFFLTLSLLYLCLYREELGYGICNVDSPELAEHSSAFVAFMILHSNYMHMHLLLQKYTAQVTLSSQNEEIKCLITSCGNLEVRWAYWMIQFPTEIMLYLDDISLDWDGTFRKWYLMWSQILIILLRLGPGMPKVILNDPFPIAYIWLNTTFWELIL